MKTSNPIQPHPAQTDSSFTLQAQIEKGLTLQNAGDYTQAEAVYSKILQRFPRNPAVLHLLGVICHQTGRNDIAIAKVSEAVHLAPENPDYLSNLGVIQAASGNLDLALNCCRRALEIDPDHADACNNLGNMYRKKGDISSAIECYIKALRQQPEDPHVLYNLGIAYRMAGKSEKEIRCYEKSLQFHPSDPKVWLNLGNALQNTGELERAIDCYKNALQCNPVMPEALNNLGSAWLTMGELGQSKVCFEAARKCKPDYAEAWSNLGNVYQNQGEYREAEKCFRHALQLKPDYVSAHSNLVYALQCCSDVDQQTIHRAASDWRHAHGAVAGTNRRPNHTRRLDDRIRVGYVSPDFRTHSVSYFFLPLLTRHDHRYFEIYCYSAVRRPDRVTDQIRALSDHWRTTLYRSDEEVAQQIRTDQIDILVDLAGHTSGNRLTVFTHKPAPIQFTWLGYPGTTGLPEIDYRITDAIADPPGESDSWHSEKLIRLPDGFLCYTASDQAPAIGPLPCRTRGHLTFGSFNNLPKMTPEVIALWSELMNLVPDARLLLKTKQLADQSVREGLLNRFAAHGIRSERIQLAGRVQSITEHLGLYNHVDIGLDPFPYNGTTTTFEALWMGVPVITLCGNRHAARVGASILSVLGLTDLVAGTKNQFLKIGTDLAQNTHILENLRNQLRQHLERSPLCDANRFAGRMEALYRRLLLERSGDPAGGV